MTPFFITGLPRSRTAWMANWLTTPVSRCFHDLLGRATTWPEFEGRLTGAIREPGDTAAVRGDSDSGLLFTVAKMKQCWPAARWLLIDRPFDEAWESYVRFVRREKPGPRFGTDGRTRKALAEGFLRAEEALFGEHDAPVLKVRYDALNDSKVLSSIWRHCMPAVRENPKRTLEMKRRNIQRADALQVTVDPETFRKEFA